MEIDTDMGDAPPKPQRRPGARAAKPPEMKPAPALPRSLQSRRYDTTTEALSQEMDSWALAAITQTLAAQEDERTRHPNVHSTPTRYRPKAPAKRFAERHPGVVSPGKDGDVDMHGDGSDTEGEDYVMETYVRVPAHTLGGPVPPEQIGVLVFDQGSDVEYFYGLEEDSDDEFLEDEDDSNGEMAPLFPLVRAGRCRYVTPQRQQRALMQTFAALRSYPRRVSRTN